MAPMAPNTSGDRHKPMTPASLHKQPSPWNRLAMPRKFPQSPTLTARGVRRLLAAQQARPIEGDGHVADRGPTVQMPRLCQRRAARPLRLDASDRQLCRGEEPIRDVRGQEVDHIGMTTLGVVEGLGLRPRPQAETAQRILDRGQPPVSQTCCPPSKKTVHYPGPKNPDAGASLRNGTLTAAVRVGIQERAVPSLQARRRQGGGQRETAQLRGPRPLTKMPRHDPLGIQLRLGVRAAAGKGHSQGGPLRGPKLKSWIALDPTEHLRRHLPAEYPPRMAVACPKPQRMGRVLVGVREAAKHEPLGVKEAVVQGLGHRRARIRLPRQQRIEQGHTGLAQIGLHARGPRLALE